jgi:uncharacterized membrane protein YeaQ/YmgE (transglycosylase-associated protein family)
MIMEILAWIIVGLVIGLSAKLLSENTSKEDGELILILAVVGSVAGGFISSAMDLTAENRWGTGTITTSIAGAVSVLLMYRGFQRY